MIMNPWILAGINSRAVDVNVLDGHRSTGQIDYHGTAAIVVNSPKDAHESASLKQSEKRVTCQAMVLVKRMLASPGLSVCLDRLLVRLQSTPSRYDEGSETAAKALPEVEYSMIACGVAPCSRSYQS